jgi:hypothetical protein
VLTDSAPARRPVRRVLAVLIKYKAVSPAPAALLVGCMLHAAWCTTTTTPGTRNRIRKSETAVVWAIWVLYWESHWGFGAGAPAGGEFFFAVMRGAGAERTQTTDHGRPVTGGQQSKDERRGDRRGKRTHYLAQPTREREGDQVPLCSSLL